MYRNAVLGAVLVCLLASSSLAQDSLAIELYGRGVHAYFAGQYEQSLSYLDESIEAEATDPRPYYYRGLVNATMGNAEKATADYKAGALAEIEAVERPYNIGRALQRVQGYARLEIETARQDARIDKKRLELKRRAARYRDLQDAEKNVLVDPGKAAPPAPAADEAPADASDPFNDGATAPAAGIATPPKTEPTAPVQPAVPDPFSNPAPAGDTPATPDTPAGDDPGTPAKPVDPFATPADPFAQPTEPAKPTTDTPAPAGVPPTDPPTDPSTPDAPTADAGAKKPVKGGASSLFNALFKVATPKISLPEGIPGIPGAPGAGPGGADPFADPPAGGDPFGGAPGGDPFGGGGEPKAPGTPPAPGEKPDDSDPFKDDPAGKPGADPFGGGTPATGDDPFGNGNK